MMDRSGVFAPQRIVVDRWNDSGRNARLPREIPRPSTSLEGRTGAGGCHFRRPFFVFGDAMINETTYKVTTLKSGQPKPYADTEREYLIECKSSYGYKEGEKTMRPWLWGFGSTPENRRADQRKWALGIVRMLCQTFRETTDKDGRAAMEAHFYPTLKWMKLDDAKGTIHVHIVEPYTD